MRRLMIQVNRAAFLLLYLVLFPRPTLASAFNSPELDTGTKTQGASGVIRGQVFIDLDRDGEYDPGEASVEGIGIEFSNGVEMQIVFTSESGTFEIEVAFGTWLVIIHPPDDYLVTNDQTREVMIGEESTLEAVMDFALAPTAPPSEAGIPTLEPEDPITDSESPEQLASQQDAIEGTSEGYSGNVNESSAAAQGLTDPILPESGGESRVLAFLSIGFVSILALGAFFIIVGKKLSR